MYKIIFFAKNVSGGADAFLRQLHSIDPKRFKKIFCFFRRDLHTRYGKDRVLLSENYPQKDTLDISQLLVFISNIQKTYSFIKSEQPHIILTCDIYSYLTVCFLKLLAFRKIPFIALINNNVYLIHKQRQNFFYSKLIFTIMRLFSRTPEVFVFVSRDLAKVTIEKISLKPRRMKIIYHSLDITEVRKLLKEKITKSQKKLIGDKKELKIFSVGRLDPQKDFETLFKAYAIIQKKYKNSKLVILGDGILRKELEGKALDLNIRSNIIFAGWQKNIYKYLKFADLVIFSSHYEGFPISILESMACGVPVIATDSPTGPREILDNGKYGFLVKVGDYQKIASIVTKLLKSKSLRSRYKNSSLTRIKMFNTQKQDYEKLFNGLVGD